MKANLQGSFYDNVKKSEQVQLRKHKNAFFVVAVVLVLIVGITVIFATYKKNDLKTENQVHFDIPVYNNKECIMLNDNVPYFNPDEYGTKVFEEYSELDGLGRCGVAFANICKELMPTEAREEIGQVKPTGWSQAKYPGVVDSNPPYLYNRCHLIGFQLAGENANEKNLITGTRYFNVEGMLPFENAVRGYVEETNHHVLYRITPVFEGDNLVAKGVIMEAWSVEDDGDGIAFNVFVYNVQPGVDINYTDGSSQLQK